MGDFDVECAAETATASGAGIVSYRLKFWVAIEGMIFWGAHVGCRVVIWCSPKGGWWQLMADS